MSVIQVTFNPTIWAGGLGAGSSYGDNGYDAFSVHLDDDGTTAWAFEYFAGGFARFNLSDGTIVHQGNIFGNNGDFLDTHDGGSISWTQGGGFYYTVFNKTIYKFHIAAGPAGNLLDGYCVVDGTLNLSANLSSSVKNMVTFTQGGVNYLGLITQTIGGPNFWLIVVNTDTMAVADNTSEVGPTDGWQVFVDNSNTLWGLFGDAASNAYLVSWTSLAGFSAPNIVSGTTMGIGTNHAPQFATYVPANNSVFLGNSINYTGDTTGISLTTFTNTALHLDDLTFFYASDFGNFDGTESAVNVGVHGGVLGVQGDILVSGSPSPVQEGGILHVINPVNLTLTSSTNITALINASAVPNPVPSLHGRGASALPPFANMVYQVASNRLIVTFYQSGSNGTPVYIVTLSAPPPPPVADILIPLPFSKRTTAAVALFACLNITSPIGARVFTTDVPTITALQLKYAQLINLYGRMIHQPTANNRTTLFAEIDEGVVLLTSLNTTMMSMTASGDNGIALAGMKVVVYNALTTFLKVQEDEFGTPF